MGNNDMFRGIAIPPSSEPFDKLFAEIDKKENNFIVLFTTKGKKVVARLSSIIVDSLDREILFESVRKKFIFFGKLITVKRMIIFERLKGVLNYSV